MEFALDIPVSGVDFLESPKEFCLERTGPVKTESPSAEFASSASSKASLAAAANAACSLYLGNETL